MLNDTDLLLSHFKPAIQVLSTLKQCNMMSYWGAPLHFKLQVHVMRTYMSALLGVGCRWKKKKFTISTFGVLKKCCESNARETWSIHKLKFMLKHGNPRIFTWKCDDTCLSALKLPVQHIPQSQPFNDASIIAIFTTLQLQVLVLNFLTKTWWFVAGSQERKGQNQPPPAVVSSQCEGSVGLRLPAVPPSCKAAQV